MSNRTFDQMLDQMKKQVPANHPFCTLAELIEGEPENENGDFWVLGNVPAEELAAAIDNYKPQHGIKRTCQDCDAETHGFCFHRLDHLEYPGISLAHDVVKNVGTSYPLVILDTSPFEHIQKYKLEGAPPAWFCSNYACGLQIEDPANGCPRCDHPADGNLCFRRLCGLTYKGWKVITPLNSPLEQTEKAHKYEIEGPHGTFAAWFCKACGEQQQH